MYVLIHLNWSAKYAQQRYRRRFGIEDLVHFHSPLIGV